VGSEGREKDHGKKKACVKGGNFVRSRNLLRGGTASEKEPSLVMRTGEEEERQKARKGRRQGKAEGKAEGKGRKG